MTQLQGMVTRPLPTLSARWQKPGESPQIQVDGLSPSRTSAARGFTGLGLRVENLSAAGTDLEIHAFPGLKMGENAE